MRGGMRARLPGHGKGGKGDSEGPPSRDACLACAGLAYKLPPSSVGPSSRGAGNRMGERGGGMAGHASRESRIRRGKGRGCPQEGRKGAVERRERGRVGKFLVRAEDRAQRGL